MKICVWRLIFVMLSFENHLVFAEKCAEVALRKGAFAFGTEFEVQFDQIQGDNQGEYLHT